MKTKNKQTNNNKNFFSRNLILVALLFLTCGLVQAQNKTNKNAKYTTEVNGNCEQCQKRIQKAAYSVTGVKSAVWNIETHQLQLILNEEKGSLLQVKNAIAKVGHDTDAVKAANVDYENLHSCCHYERQ